MSRWFRRQMKRVARFEGAVVSSVSESAEAGSSSQVVNTTTGGRSEERSQVPVRVGSRLFEGDRLILIAGGDSDTPIALSKNPYIF